MDTLSIEIQRLKEHNAILSQEYKLAYEKLNKYAAELQKLEAENGQLKEQNESLEYSYSKLNGIYEETYSLATHYRANLKAILAYFDATLKKYGDGLHYSLPDSDLFERARQLLQQMPRKRH